MSQFYIKRAEIAERLRSRGIAPTHQRIEIANALFTRCEHQSADQIMAVVNAHHSETSKATVYNTLRLFLEKGLVREVIVDPSKIFYDPNTAPHHHFYNLDSGELTDIPVDSLQVYPCTIFHFEPRGFLLLLVHLVAVIAET